MTRQPPLARYHGLDSLRASMMLLGIVLHGAIAYMAAPGLAWPFKDPYTNRFFDALVILIHFFRMPVFFVMAGFFAAFLYLSRGERYFIRNRTRRILYPFAVFWPLLFVACVGAFWYAQGETGQRTQPSLLASGRVLLKNSTWMHLWFLYDLLVFYAVALVVARIPLAASLSPNIDRLFRRVLASPLKAFWLAFAAMFSFIPMRTGMLDTTMPWIPLAPYAVFFTFGWLLYRGRDLLPLLTRGAWTHLILGLLMFPVAVRVALRLITASTEPGLGMHFAAAAVTATATALLVLGITGLFLRYLDSYKRYMRYFTDASYWIYLVHFPITIVLSGFLTRFEVSAAVKFLNVQIVTAAVTVLSYHYFVRTTFIGEMLNGKRYSRALPPAAPESARVATSG